MTTESEITPVSTTPQQKHHFEVLKYLHKIQSEHGIAEEQHIRYRQYCTRRLQRVRTAKDVKLSLKSGKKYQKIDLSADKMKTPKHLTIPLLEAERAWAFANEDQVNLEVPLEDNNGKSERVLRRHIVNRFRKSVQHAKIFEQLCEQTADQYTQLQAHYYANWLSGVLFIHQSDLKSALQQFSLCKNVLVGLTDLNDAELNAVCTARLKITNSYINFCESRLKRQGVVDLSLVATNDPTLMAKLATIREQSIQSNDLNDKNNEKLKTQKEQVVIGKNIYKIQNIKVQQALLDAKALYSNYISISQQNQDTQDNQDVSLTEQTEAKADKGFAVLVNIQAYYDNSIISLHQDLKQAEIAHQRAQTTTSEENIRNLNGLLSHLSFLRYELLFYKNYLQLTDLLIKHDIKQTVTMKTIVIMIDKLRGLVQQGTELFTNNTHLFVEDDNTNSSTSIITALQSFATYIDTLHIFYTAKLYQNITQIQMQQIASPSTTTHLVLPKDFNIEGFITHGNLPMRIKAVMTLFNHSQKEFTTLFHASSSTQINVSNPQQHNFSLIKQLILTPHYQDTITLKLDQIKSSQSQTKVLFYTASATMKDVSSTPTTSNDSANSNKTTYLLDRLTTFDTGPRNTEYNLVSLVPPIQPTPAKPFAFDTAYGLLITDNPYNQQTQQQQQKQQKEQPQTSTSAQIEPTTSETADDAPKSFWSRLWG